MAKLVSMKLDPSEDKHDGPPMPAGEGPRYPWGLTLNLDDEAIEKLDIDLPKVDSSVMVYAKALVQSVSSNQTAGGEKRRSVTLQITHLCVERGASGGDPEKTLYKE